MRSFRASKIRLNYSILFSTLVLLGTPGSLQAKEQKSEVPLPAAHARTYPAHSEEKDEKLTIAADPYNTPEKARVFQVDYSDHGLLPLRLIVSNDGDAPVSLKGMKVELVTSNKIKLTPSSTDEIFARISRETLHSREVPHQSPLPFPLPGKKKNKTPREAYEEVEEMQFANVAVEPHSTRAGFLFFDVARLRDPLAGATLYVSGVRDSQGVELLYFEIPLKP